jgi:DNA-binding transcriptional regulator YdaS (Cro superfamily)
MKLADAVKHAGSASALAELLGITPSAICQWGDVIPDNRQLQLERITLGALRADPGCMDRVLGMDKLSK